MKLFEIGTGYTPIPATMGAATEIVVEELTKAFQNDGKNVVLLDIQTDQRKTNELPIIEVPVPKLFTSTDVQLGFLHKLKRVVYSIALAGKLKNLLKEEQEEVILHFHNQYNLYFFLKLAGRELRKKAKIAYTVHSYIWPGEWDEIKDTVKKKYFQEIYCVKNADYVFVLNDKTARHFVEHLEVKKENIYKISNGVNTEIYSRMTQKETDDFKEKLGIPGRKMIFQAGSVCDRKNQLGAVQMLSEYMKEHKNVVYMYAGGIIDRGYKEEIDDFAREKGIEDQVLYVGELAPGSQLNEYYNGAHVTLFPSKVESFGLVIIESIAAGTPVLLKEKPLFHLEDGYSVYEDEEDFIKQVDAFLKAEKDGRIREEVLRKYSWNAVARQHFDIFTR